MTRIAALQRGCTLLLSLCLVGTGCRDLRRPPSAVNTAAAGEGTSRTPSASPVQFTDVTARAGIAFRHDNGAAGRYFLPETMGAGCAFFDYDGDGWLDILLLNGRPLAPAASSTLNVQGSRLRPGPTWNREPATVISPKATVALYRNNRNGTFTDVTAAAGLRGSLYGMGCAVGDCDNDGDADLFLTGLGRNAFYRNRGNGTFADETDRVGLAGGGWSTSAAWLDYDRDGRLDLFVGRYVEYDLATDAPCARGGLPVYCGPIPYEPSACLLYHGERDGTFRDVSRAAGVARRTGKALGVAVWDVDEDGWPDIVVANDVTPNHLFRNNHDGTFAEVAAESGVAFGEDGTARSGMGIDIAEYRNDGRPAIFISNFSREPNSFFVRERPGLFVDRTYAAGLGESSLLRLGFGLFFFDYDNDGWRDALVTNGHIEPQIERFESPITHAQPALLYRNTRDGRFEEVSLASGTALTRPRVGRGAAYGDYDRDGDLDLLLSNNGGPAELLRNDGGSRQHWLRLRLVGRKSSRDGLGARVRVVAAGLKQRDQARSGSSYLSQSADRLHFGLGTATAADLVEVAWPSGITDHLERVPAGQTVTIQEGQSRGGIPSHPLPEGRASRSEERLPEL